MNGSKKHGYQRFALAASLAAAALIFACPSTALELRVATWNIEHLADTNAEGCVGREDADYSALAERIDTLDADVVAFQEVENAAAAQRVFDEARWSVEVSTRRRPDRAPRAEVVPQRDSDASRPASRCERGSSTRETPTSPLSPAAIDSYVGAPTSR